MYYIYKLSLDNRRFIFLSTESDRKRWTEDLKKARGFSTTRQAELFLSGLDRKPYGYSIGSETTVSKLVENNSKYNKVYDDLLELLS
jgi:hypothetical protein